MDIADTCLVVSCLDLSKVLEVVKLNHSSESIAIIIIPAIIVARGGEGEYIIFLSCYAPNTSLVPTLILSFYRFMQSKKGEDWELLYAIVSKARVNADSLRKLTQS